jgi:hypothetical protein
MVDWWEMLLSHCFLSPPLAEMLVDNLQSQEVQSRCRLEDPANDPR